MAYAKKTPVTAPEYTFDVDADRFWAGDGTVSVQVRLERDGKVFLSYWDEGSGDLRLTEDVPWESFCWELKAMIERLKEQ